MKPIIILPPHAVSKKDIAKLENNGICVVVVKDPANIKFLDPIIPAMSSRTEIEKAAIALSRKLLNGEILQYQRGDVTKTFVDLLVKGTPLDVHFVDIEKLKKQEAKKS